MSAAQMSCLRCSMILLPVAAIGSGLRVRREGGMGDMRVGSMPLLIWTQFVARICAPRPLPSRGVYRNKIGLAAGERPRVFSAKGTASSTSLPQVRTQDGFVAGNGSSSNLVQRPRIGSVIVFHDSSKFCLPLPRKTEKCGPPWS
jgi:hypothetical protein